MFGRHAASNEHLPSRAVEPGQGHAETGVHLRTPVLLAGTVVVLGGFGLFIPATASAAATPSVTSLSSSSGRLAGGGRLTLHGRGFSHVRSVRFGTVVGKAVHVNSSTSLSVTVPNHAAATVNVRVRTATGTSRAVKADHYRFVAPPAVASLSASSGSTAGAVTLSISGSNFYAVTSVRFGSTAATGVRVLSSRSLTAVVPAHSAGHVSVKVTGRYGTSASGTAARYTYSTDTLAGGQALTTGQSLWSLNGRYQAVMQGDGNFVLYGPRGAIWSTSTTGTGSNMVVMQSDANLVVYSPGGHAHWSSETAPGVGLRLVVQSDGNLVMYAPNNIAIWTYASGRIGSEDTLTTGNTLGTNQSLYSLDGRYRATMQGDGNLVVYGPSGATWSTSTTAANATLAMQGDGNLVIYAAGGRAVWSSETAPSSSDRLIMQSDGNLVIYNSSGTALWALGHKVGGTSSGLGAAVDGFVAHWNNVGADYDGQYGFQCVDLFNYYSRDVVHAKFASVDYAYQLYDTYDSAKYNRLPANATPQKGDVAIWASNSPNSGGAGHVAIVLSAAGSTLTIFTQNPGVSHVGTHSTAYLRGYLRPNT